MTLHRTHRLRNQLRHVRSAFGSVLERVATIEEDRKLSRAALIAGGLDSESFDKIRLR